LQLHVCLNISVLPFINQLKKPPFTDGSDFLKVTDISLEWPGYPIITEGVHD